VVKMIQDKKLTFDDIERDRKEHEGNLWEQEKKNSKRT
jgi:hypothetical protein